jgi:hypothetical protein
MKTKLLLIAGLMMLGCGGGSSAGASCTRSGAGVQTCIEIAGATAAQQAAFQAACSSGSDGGGTGAALFITLPCTRTNAVGGCTVSAGGFTQTSWSYAPADETAVRAQCMASGGTFVAP